MSQKIVIDPRFNGPPDSGNGGYSCGLLGRCFDEASVVTLRRPPPLGVGLTVDRPDADSALLLQGETVIAEARREPLVLDVPRAPTLEQARAAMAGYPGMQRHVFPTCFVCGPRRRPADGLQLFPGPLADRVAFSTQWTPQEHLPRDGDVVKPEIVWAALDCPSYFPFHPALAVLGRLHAQTDRRPRIGQPLVVFSWIRTRDGRKLNSGAAIADAAGDLLARAAATWIVLQPGSTDFRLAT